MSANILLKRQAAPGNRHDGHAVNLPRSLKIGGITPFSSVDYPGQLAAVLFIQGCPLRCAYCHNPHLQSRHGQHLPAFAQVLAWLERRVGLLDAVVFSGGEPTLDPALATAMREVAHLGFRVGLHSAGIYPQRLEALLPLIDWIGLDIKTGFEDYAQLTGLAVGGHVQTSLKAVLASGVPHECRTTIHPDLITQEQLLNLAQQLASMGVKHYAWQRFRPQGCQHHGLIESARATMANYPSPQLIGQVATLFPNFDLRDG